MIASIPSPSSNGIGVGPFEIHAYGLMYAFAVAAAVVIVTRRWRKLGGDPDLPWEVAIWAFPAGLIGGRLYFDITSFNEMPHTWWGPVRGLGRRPRDLGRDRRRRGGRHLAGPQAPAPRSPTSWTPPPPPCSSPRRSGGSATTSTRSSSAGPTNLPWALQISPAHRPEGYIHYATFQPTFLYEIIWNLALAAFLVWLGHHRKIKPPGLFALYVAGYSAFRIFEESLRVDPAHHILGQRLNFWVAIVLTIVGLAWFAWTQRAEAREPLPPVDRPPPGEAGEGRHDFVAGALGLASGPQAAWASLARTQGSEPRGAHFSA